MKPNNGFLYAASKEKKYLNSAIFSAESLREYYPNASITIFTTEEWARTENLSVFNNVITKSVPNHKRTKLYALTKTPYNLTAYIDADIEVKHKDINSIFDQIPQNADILTTKIREYSGNIVKFPGGRLTDHCGMFLYRKNTRTMKFMDRWWQLYQEQHDFKWKWETRLYPENLRSFDQWAYWWIINKENYKIEIDYFKDDARWNFINNYKPAETDKPIIMYHHTLRD